MVERSKQAWNEVGERFSTWGRLVAERYRGSEEPGPTAEETRKDLEDAAKGLAEQLNRAFTALGDTIRDPQAKQELAGAVKALGDAVSVTVSEAGEEIRKRFGSERPDDEHPAA
jgi:hypothetical protein